MTESLRGSRETKQAPCTKYPVRNVASASHAALLFLRSGREPQRNLEPEPSDLEACEIHDGLNEDGVVTYVRVFALELGEGAKERTATGDVHLTHRPLEGGGSDIRPEGINDVLTVTLVEQHQGHLQMGEIQEIWNSEPESMLCQI